MTDEACRKGAADYCCRYLVPTLRVLAVLFVIVAAMKVPAA